MLDVVALWQSYFLFKISFLIPVKLSDAILVFWNIPFVVSAENFGTTVTFVIIDEWVHTSLRWWFTIPFVSWSSLWLQQRWVSSGFDVIYWEKGWEVECCWWSRSPSSPLCWIQFVYLLARTLFPFSMVLGLLACLLQFMLCILDSTN